MGKMAITKLCRYKGCKNPAVIRDCYCYSHLRKATITRFLSSLYTVMNRRIKGKGTRRPDLYLSKPIMPKDVFMNWAKNHPDFLSLYKQWITCNFDRKLTPTVNRMNPNKGYTLDNVEWLTNSQNCGLSSSVRSLKARKEIYNLLGVNDVKN